LREAKQIKISGQVQVQEGEGERKGPQSVWLALYEQRREAALEESQADEV
jgi:hypothetical protein